MALENKDIALHTTIFNDFIANCPQPEGVVNLEYIWIDGSKQQTRSKTRTVAKPIRSAADCPEWNFDGSSTGQAKDGNTDIYLKPVAIYNDPWLRGENKLVLCETMLFDRTPIPSNTRHSCAKVMAQATDQDPWFGIEQEYSLMDPKTGLPLGWPADGTPPEPQGPYYCGIEPGRSIGREFVMAHLRACQYAGLKICGINAEVMPSQWEYQIGPCAGIDIGDQMWVSRYILTRLASAFNISISLDPKIIPGDWNGAGAHTNFSTNATRDKSTGLKAIHGAIEKLSKRHREHIETYDPLGGKDNARRLTGRHETASIDVFSSGVAQRNVSIRIPAQVNKDGFGYLEDRRPASNCDPYVVSERLVRTICLDE